MDSISLSNLRSLVDCQAVPIKPITILLGKNGSGKSTLLRFFPLLRQTVESRTRETLLWFGKYVDFGGFKDAISRNASNKNIVIKFSVGNVFQNFPRFYYDKISVPSIDTTLSVGYDDMSGRSYVQSIEILMNEDRINIESGPSGNIKKFIINDENILSYDIVCSLISFNRIVPHLEWEKQKVIRYHRNFFRFGFFTMFPDNIETFLTKEISQFFGKSPGDERKMEALQSLKYGDDDHFYNSLLNSPKGSKPWERNIGLLNQKSEKILKLKRLFIVGCLPIIMNQLNEYLIVYGKNISYIAPLRATAERFYREQGLAVDKVDHLGQNLAMFLRSLGEAEKARFKEWTKAYLGFEANTRQIKSQIDITINETGSDKEYNLIDMGFGFSQILPVAAQLWAMTEVAQRKRRPDYFDHDESDNNIPRLLAIEQPELHLHPCYQAKIADALASTISMAKKNKIDVRILVETHSEALINRCGQLVQRGDLSYNDVSIVLFDKEKPDSNTSISITGFDQDGYLKEWPYGFFEPTCGQ